MHPEIQLVPSYKDGPPGQRQSEPHYQETTVQSQDIRCPKCAFEFAITEALARPIVEAERNRMELEICQRSTALAAQEEELQRKHQQLDDQQQKLKIEAAGVEKLVQDRLELQRAGIVAVEAKRIEGQFQNQLNASRREQEAQEAKIAQMEAAELEFRKKSTALDQQKRQLELTVARQLDEERESIRREAMIQEQKRSQAALAEKDGSLAELTVQLAESKRVELDVRKQREALKTEKESLDLLVMRRVDKERERIREEEENRNHFKLAEKDKLIDDMRKQAEEIRRKSEQGSQQGQGEIPERALEANLRSQFTSDEFEPVAIGRAGADLIQKVIGPGGAVCGTILWEWKCTKDWQEVWLSKVRENQRSAHATLGVIASKTLRKGIVNFDCIDDVWVSSFDCIVPLAKALRAALIQTNLAQVSGQDRSGKTERVYSYVTGQDFKHRVSSIHEVYVTLQKELEKEKSFVNRAWARRAKYHEQIMFGIEGMRGELHGIVGESMPEIDGLEAPDSDGETISLATAKPVPLQSKELAAD
jgi:hypothetical protein